MGKTRGRLFALSKGRALHTADVGMPAQEEGLTVLGDGTLCCPLSRATCCWLQEASLGQVVIFFFFFFPHSTFFLKSWFKAVSIGNGFLTRLQAS